MYIHIYIYVEIYVYTRTYAHNWGKCLRTMSGPVSLRLSRVGLQRRARPSKNLDVVALLCLAERTKGRGRIALKLEAA